MVIATIGQNLRGRALQRSGEPGGPGHLLRAPQHRPDLRKSIALSALISAWLAGLLGGAHCVAMCGGFVAALAAARSPRRRTCAVRRTRTPRFLAGRIASYALVGAGFGAVGGLALAAPSVLSLQRGLYVVANVFLLVLAVAMATGAGGNSRLQQAGGALFRGWFRWCGRCVRTTRCRRGSASASSGVSSPAASPTACCRWRCSPGSGIEGAAVMLAFGVGTLPSLLIAGWMAGRARRWLATAWVRYAAAALLTAFAAAGIWRALFGPMATGRGLSASFRETSCTRAKIRR